MNEINEIFNNREIAIGLWIFVALIIMLINKATRKFIADVISTLLCKDFLVFGAVFIAYLVAVLHILKWTEFWDTVLLKDTIFWVLFVELPIFSKAIEKADGARFFCKLIKENLAVAAVIEFFVGFWSFSLIAELIIVPVTVFVSLIYAVASRDPKHSLVKRFFEFLSVVWGAVLLINAISCLTQNPNMFFNLDTLKSLILPIVLLIFNLPIVYGLALYNMYDQVFKRIKGVKTEKRKMKWQVAWFARLNLAKISALRRSIPDTIFNCKNSKQLKINLANLSKRLDLQIGDNYMKRSHYYLLACLFGIIISLVVLIGVNSNVTLKELVTFNFVFNVPKINEILTYVFSSLLVFCICLAFFAIGFNKKQREDITQIKKFALYELLHAVKTQERQLKEFPPLEHPDMLYDIYVRNAYDIKVACDKTITAYDNLFTNWERETVKNLQISAMMICDDFGINEENADDYTKLLFCDYYNEKVKNAPQSANFNSYISTTKTDLDKYSARVKQFCEDFKYCY